MSVLLLVLAVAVLGWLAWTVIGATAVLVWLTATIIRETRRR